jgi:hypothetical protein
VHLITIVAMTDVATLAMIDTGTTVIGRTGHIVVTVPGLLLAAPPANMKIVVHPGLHPPGGRLMIKGLQGTMITGEEAMMTAERLIIILNVAGMIMTDAGTTEDATKKMNASMTGLRGTRTGKAVGRLVEWFFGLGTSFAAAGFGWKQTAFNGGILLSWSSLLHFGVCLRGPCTSQCSVGQRAVAHIRISIH